MFFGCCSGQKICWSYFSDLTSSIFNKIPCLLPRVMTHAVGFTQGYMPRSFFQVLRGFLLKLLIKLVENPLETCYFLTANQIRSLSDYPWAITRTYNMNDESHFTKPILTHFSHLNPNSLNFLILICSFKCYNKFLLQYIYIFNCWCKLEC